MDWFRSHHGAPIDPKLRLVAKRCGLPTGNVAAIWWALMDHASQAQVRGSIAGFDPEVLAVAFDYDTVDISRCLKEMRNAFLVSERFTLVSWERRQTHVGNTSTERVRRHRLRKKEKAVSETHGTLVETAKRSRADQNREEIRKSAGAGEDPVENGDNRAEPEKLTAREVGAFPSYQGRAICQRASGDQKTGPGVGKEEEASS